MEYGKRKRAFRKPVVRVRTKEKCPRCSRKFVQKRDGLFCPRCGTTPRRYFVDLTFRGERIRIYSDKNGQVLSSWEQASRLAEHIKYEIDHGIFDPELYKAEDLKRFRVDSLLEKYLKEKEKTLKWAYFRMKRVRLKKFAEYLKNENISDVREIRPLQLNDFINELFAQGLSQKTVKHYRTEIDAFLNWCEQLQIIAKKPRLPEIRVPEPVIRWLSIEDQLKILENIPEQHRDIFMFLFIYGLRPSEARALMWDCVHLKKNLIEIRRNFSAKRLVEITKENRVKFLPIVGPVREMLLRRAENRPLEYVFWHQDNPSKRPSHYGEVKLRSIFKEACKACGIKDINLYQAVRHSKVIHLLEKKYSYEQIGAIMGHADPQTTRKYGRLNAVQVSSALEETAKLYTFPSKKKQKPSKKDKKRNRR